MKNSTRNMLRAAAIAPVAVLLAGAPAHAATDGPTASLVRGITARTPVAGTADPVVKVAVDLVDGLVTAGQGEAQVQEMPDGAQEAVAQLTGATAEVLGFHATGLTARCTATADGQASGLTQITSGQALGRDLPLVPAAGTRLSLAGGAFVILNRQVTDAGGGLTVTGASLTSKTGEVTDLGIARCDSAERVTSARRTAVSAARKAPVPPVGGMVGDVVASTHSATSPVSSVTGGLGGVGAPHLHSIKPLTGITDSPSGPTNLPDAPPMGLPDSLSGLLGGLPGLPGGMPTGVMSVLPDNPRDY
jgi:hypothetical protein